MKPRTAIAITAAAFAAACAVHSVPASAQSSRSGDTAIARDEFHRGQSLYENQRYQEALEHFRASLAQLDSPNTLLYIGRCQRELGRPALAYRAFDRAARVAAERRAAESRFEATFRSASEERDALSSRVGFVVLHSLRDATAIRGVVVAGDSLGQIEADAPIAVAPGDVQLAAEFDGRTLRRRLHIEAGATRTWIVGESAHDENNNTPNPPPVSTLPAPSVFSTFRIVALTAAGVGVASITASIVVGVVAQGQYDQLVRDCSNGPCPPSRAGDVEAGATLVTTTNLLLAAGLTLAVAGGLGFVLAPRGSSSGSPTRVSASIAPMGDGWAVGVVGRF